MIKTGFADTSDVNRQGTIS